MRDPRVWLAQAIGAFGQYRTKEVNREAARQAEAFNWAEAVRDEWDALVKRQFERLRAGSEIEPPWVVTPDYEPRNYARGGYNDFEIYIWRPYIRAMPMDQRTAYFTKWPLPPGPWYPYIRSFIERIDDSAR